MRGKNFIVLFAVLFASLVFVSAVSYENITCQNLESQKEMAIGFKIPDKAPFTDEIINVYLNGSIFGNIVIENRTLKDFSCLEKEDATYKIFVKNRSVVSGFINSEDVLQTYKDKSDLGEVKIKGVGLVKKIKLGFVKLFLNFI
jgi:hypothetical protein